MVPEFSAIESVLDEVRPALRRDGGDIEVVAFADGVVRVRLLGACGSCGLSKITLKFGVEKALVGLVPGVIKVEAV